MNRFFYSLLLYLLSPIIWAYFLFRAIKAPEYRDGFWQRLGNIPKNIKSKGILVHCASVGEVRAAAPLIHQLAEAFTDFPITVSTTTPTGKKAVKTLFGDSVSHVYLPVDWPGSARRFLARLKPELVILMETELWFNLLFDCHRRQIPVLLANARLSDKSVTKYLKHENFSRQLFSFVSIIAAQYQSDKDNFLSLGIAKDNIKLVGSIKFDLEVDTALKIQQEQLKQSWAAERPVWIAASIHPAEFDWILTTHKQLLKKMPDLLLIGVPRHPEKFGEFKSTCANHQLSYVNRSEEKSPDKDTQVVVADTMGEMMLFCGVADLAYVGGSLIERGGHNPLEPLACGTPVVMGPHFYNFADICEQLIAHRLMEVVADQAQLTSTIGQLFTELGKEQTRQQEAHSFMQNNRGCVDRLIELSQSLLTQKSQ